MSDTDGHGNGNGNWTAFWRTLALMAATALVTGFGAWLLFDRDQPSREEVAGLVATLAGEVKNLREDQANVRDKLSTINGKLDVWLNNMPVRELPTARDQERRR